MESLSRVQKLALIFISMLFLLWVGFLSFNLFKSTKGNVLQAEDVNISAGIFGCNFNITAKPEKRIPAINNWSTLLNVEIYNTSNVLQHTFSVTTDSFGQASKNLCADGIYLSGSTNYNFYIKGQSTLKMEFTNLPAFEFITTSIDFSSPSIRLFNGETGNTYNNVINTLDISTQITRIGTSSTKEDLNRDGEVNILDVSNTITNFGLKGDCSPFDVANGYCI